MGAFMHGLVGDPLGISSGLYYSAETDNCRRN